MPSIKKAFLTFFLIGLLLLLGIITTFSMLGRSFLVIDAHPQDREAIIVLSGDEGRLSYALQWYEPGTPVIITNATEPPTTKAHAIELGAHATDIIEENEATSTYTNATLSKDIMKEHGFDSALVVTSDYHSRRTKMTFDKIYESTAIELSYATAPSHFSKGGSMTRSDHLTAVSEYVKLTGYWITLFVF